MQCTWDGKVCEYYPCKTSTGNPDCDHDFSNKQTSGDTVTYKCTKCDAMRRESNAKTV